MDKKTESENKSIGSNNSNTSNIPVVDGKQEEVSLNAFTETNAGKDSTSLRKKTFREPWPKWSRRSDTQTLAPPLWGGVRSPPHSPRGLRQLGRQRPSTLGCPARHHGIPDGSDGQTARRTPHRDW